jgi:glucose/arabinose dehydrogenase
MAVPLAASSQPAAPVQLAVQALEDTFEQPVLVTAPTGDGRLFIVDQPGVIWIVQEGDALQQPFLDIRDIVDFGGEQGLLGLAFHPDYASNGRFFINHTDRNGDTRVAEYRVSSDPNRADPESGTTLISIADPAGNHNGGWLDFGPDGYLYIANGDGGGGGDPYQNGQNPNGLFAKILRIDVNSGSPYGIPPDNPFAGGGGQPEAFILGLRNPWRVSFDGNDIYIADVGQNAWEEVHVVTTGDGGANLGWNIMEGAHCYGAANCDTTGLVMPVYEYPHSQGACSITGGYVYRGSAIPEIQGHYFFGDYCAGFVRSFRHDNGAATELIDWTVQMGNVGNITSFGRDAAGELYITSTNGRVYKIVRAN